MHSTIPSIIRQLETDWRDNRSPDQLKTPIRFTFIVVVFTIVLVTHMERVRTGLPSAPQLEGDRNVAQTKTITTIIKFWISSDNIMVL